MFFNEHKKYNDSMEQVSINRTQSTSQKKYKTSRSSLEMSYKIIAFEEIANANPEQSARQITRLLNIPNSTMQSWRENKTIVEENLESEIAVFLTTLAGQKHLNQVVLAAMYNAKCGRSGLNGMQDFLRHSGLDKHVASSMGTLQNFWR